jgi:hypothetical protein
MTSITYPSPNNAWGCASITALGTQPIVNGSGKITPPVVAAAAGDSTCVANIYDAETLGLSSLTWSDDTVTATTASPHGLTVDDTYTIAIVGAVPTGYNGVFTATVTGASTFTYPLSSNPGTETVAGTYAVLNNQIAIWSLSAGLPSQSAYLTAVAGPSFSNGLFVNMTGTTAGAISISWIGAS